MATWNHNEPLARVAVLLERPPCEEVRGQGAQCGVNEIDVIGDRNEILYRHVYELGITARMIPVP